MYRAMRVAHYVGFWVLIAATTKNTIHSHVTQCILEETRTLCSNMLPLYLVYPEDYGSTPNRLQRLKSQEIVFSIYILCRISRQSSYQIWSLCWTLLIVRYIYRVIQKESAILWEMIVYVILSKKVHINMFPIFDGYGVMGIF
jgi:hypothetical protein